MLECWNAEGEEFNGYLLSVIWERAAEGRIVEGKKVRRYTLNQPADL